MGILDLFSSRRKGEPEPDPRIRSAIPFDGSQIDLGDPRLAEFLRDGDTSGDLPINATTITRTTAVFRCLDILCSSVGKLPLYLMQKDPNTGEKSFATNHPLYDILLHKPNPYQTAQQFKAYLQYQMLVEGDGFALIVRTGTRVTNLIPLDATKVKVSQNPDWSLSYVYTKPDGSKVNYSSDEILHLRGLSRDGIRGIARAKEARNAIALSMHAEKAATKLFRNGMILGGVLSHPKKLGKIAYDNLKSDMREQYQGSENAWNWIIAEEGMEATELKGNAVSAQHLEQRKMQIEEIARVFGVPRPLLMMDDTSWGSGIEQLAILFVRFGLSEWFTTWESAINTTLLTPRDRLLLYADFDEKELLRGSMKDQADFYAKALGSGGQPPWMTQNEVRGDVGLGDHPDGDVLYGQNVNTAGSTAASPDTANTPPQPRKGAAANDI